MYSSIAVHIEIFDFWLNTASHRVLHRATCSHSFNETVCSQFRLRPFIHRHSVFMYKKCWVSLILLFKIGYSVSELFMQNKDFISAVPIIDLSSPQYIYDMLIVIVQSFGSSLHPELSHHNPRFAAATSSPWSSSFTRSITGASIKTKQAKYLYWGFWGCFIHNFVTLLLLLISLKFEIGNIFRIESMVIWDMFKSSPSGHVKEES